MIRSGKPWAASHRTFATMHDSNPYQAPVDEVPPRYQEPPGPTRRIIWAGPLLTMAIFSLFLALMTSTVTVTPGGEWIQGVVTVSFLVFGLLCLGVSLYMYRRARRAARRRQAEIQATRRNLEAAQSVASRKQSTFNNKDDRV